MQADGDFEWCCAAITVAEMGENGPAAITLAVRSIDEIIHKEERQNEILALAAEPVFLSDNSRLKTA